MHFYIFSITFNSVLSHHKRPLDSCTCPVLYTSVKIYWSLQCSVFYSVYLYSSRFSWTNILLRSDQQRVTALLLIKIFSGLVLVHLSLQVDWLWVLGILGHLSATKLFPDLILVQFLFQVDWLCVIVILCVHLSPSNQVEVTYAEDESMKGKTKPVSIAQTWHILWVLVPIFLCDGILTYPIYFLDHSRKLTSRFYGSRILTLGRTLPHLK